MQVRNRRRRTHGERTGGTRQPACSRGNKFTTPRSSMTAILSAAVINADQDTAMIDGAPFRRLPAVLWVKTSHRPRAATQTRQGRICPESIPYGTIPIWRYVRRSFYLTIRDQPATSPAANMRLTVNKPEYQRRFGESRPWFPSRGQRENVATTVVSHQQR